MATQAAGNESRSMILHHPDLRSTLSVLSVMKKARACCEFIVFPTIPKQWCLLNEDFLYK